MRHCEVCDIEGPTDPRYTLMVPEVERFHRAFHSLCRQLAEPIYKILFGGNK